MVQVWPWPCCFTSTEARLLIFCRWNLSCAFGNSKHFVIKQKLKLRKYSHKNQECHNTLLLTQSDKVKSSWHTETQHSHTHPVICTHAHTHTHTHTHARTHTQAHTHTDCMSCKLGWMCNLTHPHTCSQVSVHFTPTHGIYSERLVTQSALWFNSTKAWTA